MTDSASTIALHEVRHSTRCLADGRLQIVWGFEGRLQLELDGGTASVSPGHALVIAPGRCHAVSAPRGARCFVVASSEARHLERLLPLAGQLLAHDQALGYLLRYLAAQPALSPSTAQLLLDSVPAGTEPAARSAGRNIDWSRLLAWIDSHLAEPLDVAALAAQVHLSATQFAARCTAEFGIAPMALVRRQRRAAALRLRAIGMPVGTVAARCGYRSPSALTAALKRDALTR
jgi:AraC-like DNA-binding protein